MVSRRTGLRLGLAVAALGLLAGWARAADDDKALRQRVLDLNQVTGDLPTRGALLTLLEDKPAARKLLAVAVRMAKEKDAPLNYNAASILARAAQDLKDLDATVALYRVCIDEANKVKSPTKAFLSYTGIIAAYELAGKFDESVKACKEFLALPELKTDPDPDNPDQETPKYNATLRRGQDLIRRELIQLLVKDGKIDEANKVVDERLSKDEDDTDALELRALIQRESGNYAAAAKTYEGIIERANGIIDKVKSNPTLPGDKKDEFVKSLTAEVRDYRYILSGLYIEANDVTKAADTLKDLLKEDPENPSYNNDLGYVWADHDMNLADAEKLIRKAIDDDKKKQAKDKPDLKPDQIKANAAYLDSLGWVLFKQKKYKEALPPLQEAVEQEEGQHIEIFDHLAEVQMALGNKAAALDAWKKGVEKAGTNKKERERKVEVQKKIRGNQ